MRSPVLVPFVRPILVVTALLAATAVHAQAQNAGRNLNVMAVNSASGSSNGQIYSITFAPPGGSTTVGNTDANNYVRPQALAFVTNATTNQLDLLVADNQRGTIYRYPGALAPQTPPNPTTGTLVWNSQSSGTGPVAPNALAVDGFGNLFVANSTSGHSQAAQLWEFPVGASGSGSFATPVLLDSNFQNKETLLEVTLAPTDVAGATGVAGGDLIVLTTSRVLAYSQSSGYTSRITLLSFPNGAPLPGGMDFWPLGNGTTANYSLLVSSNSSGTIARYYFTNPLTAAPAPFYSGLGTLYRVKTLFQAGNPLLFVSENGAILEFGANASGNGNLLATVTQNVTVPQGLAVSNSFTNAFSVCLQSAGCDLTGLLTHTITGVSSLTGNIVENVCTVNADPRVAIIAGVWSCSVPYTPPPNLHFTCPPGTSSPGCLPVNAFCPGFDDTGKMAIPDSVCGRSGSSGAGFSLIKTLVSPGQLAGAYVQNSAVLADGSNPLCGAGSGADGAFLWAPLLAEGTVQESPNMVDVTSGCGSVHGGTEGVSVWGVGLSVNEAASELAGGGLPRPLENYAQTKYTNFTNTIDSLTQANTNFPQWTDTVPNIASSVSLQLWGGNVPPNTSATPFGCLDQSWLDFFNATQVDADGSAQWTADLQNAANLLTNADATGATTCDGITNTALATNPAAFVQTPNANYPNGPTEPNPYGQVRSRLANLYYTINTRILGNAASTSWPLPVSVNVVPTAVTLASSSSPGSATLSWNTNGDSGCTFGSSDGTYPNGSALSNPMPLTIPAADAGTIVTYTVTCASGPGASSVSAYVNVYPPPTLTLSTAAVAQGSAATLTWNTNGAQGCTASSTDATFAGTKTGKGSMSVSPAAAGAYTYTLACSNPATTVSTSLTVVAPPTVSLSAGSTLVGTGATLSWTANGNTGCTWSSTDPAINGKAATSSPTAVQPASAGTYSYALACTGPIASTSPPVTLTVVQPPSVGLSTASVLQGTGATLTWNTFASVNPNPWTCTWSSNDGSFVSPAGGSGSTTVKPASAGTYTYTLTCPSPTTPVSATLTVTAPQAPLLSVSPSSVTVGSSANLTWTLYAGDVCTASTTDPNDTFAGPLAVGNGSTTVKPKVAGTYSYTLTCSAPAVTKYASLTVTPQLAKIAISISGLADDDTDDRGTLAWTLSGGATGCVVSGTFPPHSVPQFSAFPVSASGSKQLTSFRTAGTYTYTLSCTNPATPVQTSVTIRSTD